MSKLLRLSACAIAIAGLSFAAPAMAEHHEGGPGSHEGPSGGPHGGMTGGPHGGMMGGPHGSMMGGPHGSMPGGPFGGMHTGSPFTGGPHGGNIPESGRPSRFEGRFNGPHDNMPPHGFHETPPGFHGQLPHGGPAPSHAMNHHELGGPGHDMATFHGHNFANFTAGEREEWEHGGWRHTWHHGHFGWWWFVGDFWFFYPEPIYPFPLYIGPYDYYDYYDEYGAPYYYWYYCEDPPGYYPYIRVCLVPWEPVPPYDY